MGKLLIVLALALLPFVAVQAQSNPKPNEKPVVEEPPISEPISEEFMDEAVFEYPPVPNNGNDIFIVVEQMPTYPGGNAAMTQYLQKIVYPSVAKDSLWEGTTYLQFVVEKDGSVSSITVPRSSGHKILDDAAKAHLAQMPKWTPGYQNGKPVRVQYALPFRFSL